MTDTAAARLWDVDLIERQGPGTLVRVAKEGRLLRLSGGSSSRLELHWMDEAALALVDAAIARDSSLTLLYPALAPEVGVLLAAQYLIHALAGGRAEPSVGLVTADPARAAQIWEELRVESQGARVPFWEVFPYWRASPDGDAPFNGLLRGIVIGRTCARWAVDLTVVDDLAGPVEVDASGPVIRVAADPLDYELDRAVDDQRPLWGWSEGILRMYSPPPRPASAIPRSPFSIASDRVSVLTRGLTTTVQVCEHEEGARWLGEARAGLVRMSELAGDRPRRHVLTGLRVAWAHLATLTSLPCPPSEYDKWAGVPPRAARSTSDFEREVAGWARTLKNPLRDLAEDVAAALGELRRALQSGNPLRAAIERASLDPSPGYLIVRTRTAARAVCDAFGQRPEDLKIGSLRVTWNAELHRVQVRQRAIVVGAPPRSAWHKLASGLAPRVEVLVLGEDEEKRAHRAWQGLQVGRAYWSGQRFRSAAWRRLFGEPLPPPYPEPDVPVTVAAVYSGPGFSPAVDPFTPLGALMRDDRPLLAAEGIADQLVEIVSEREVRATVAVVEVHTDKGYVLIPGDREVDIILADQLESVIATGLTKGMRLILGRQGGRLDLLAALEERLGHRPDLFVARALVEEYQKRVYKTFKAYVDGGLVMTDFCRTMRNWGCKKTDTAIRGWVQPGGAMGPRDYEDLHCLSGALRLGYGETRLKEIDAALKRIRVFRQHAGLAVSRAATAALLSREDSRVNEELGLSVADLREAVTVATVQGLRSFPRQVNVTEIGHLQEVPFV